MSRFQRWSLTAVFFTAVCFVCAPLQAKDSGSSIEAKLMELEKKSGGRLGVYAATAAGNDDFVIAAYRADELFPFCSTFKMMLAAAVLKRSETDEGLLAKRITYNKDKLISWSPITEKNVAGGMTVSELCAATVQYSDNAAANLLIDELGGPEAVTAFARSIGDTVFSLNRMEPELNSAEPGDTRDTTSPAAMGNSLKRLALEDALSAPNRELLQNWLKGNTTGAERIRAGVPEGWIVGDKTGSGAYGITNDIAVIWPSDAPPIVLVVYFIQKDKNASSRSDVLAEATRIVIEAID